MITRQIGKLVRGKATPFQIFAACLLASFIAFVPGFARAPGLLIFWIGLLVVLNANLFLAGIVGAVAKLAALLLAPVSFAIGRALLEGPTRGGFAALVNAPVFAWFGFEYPLVTGGQFVALLLGLAVGWAVIASMRRMWAKLGALEKDSAAFQTWTEKKWVKFASFIFVGGLKGKQSYEALLTRRVGNPVRVLGVVLVVLVLGLGAIAARFFDDAIVTSVIRSGLERANGATVDLAGASLDPAGGALTLQGLALCDPGDLTSNIFAAKTVEAKFSTTDLLRRRATVDLVSITGAEQGSKRPVPGRHIGPPPESTGDKWKLPDMQSLDDVLKNAQVWRERLGTARRWLERFSGGSKEAKPADGAPTYEDILRERVRLEGYANVRDDSLIEKSPTLLVRRIEARDVKVASLPAELLALTVQNVSTEPRLVSASPRVDVTSASGTIGANLALDALAGATSLGHLDFFWKGLAVDDVASQLKAGEGKPPPVSGGTLDVSVRGMIGLVDSNLPLTLTLHDTKLSLGGSEPTPISELAVPVAVRGPIDHPSIRVDQDGLQKALIAAGKKELTNRLQSELQKKLGGDAKPGGDVKDTAKDLLDGLLNKKKKTAEPEPAKPPTPQP